MSIVLTLEVPELNRFVPFTVQATVSISFQPEDSHVNPPAPVTRHLIFSRGSLRNQSPRTEARGVPSGHTQRNYDLLCPCDLVKTRAANLDPKEREGTMKRAEMIGHLKAGECKE